MNLDLECILFQACVYPTMLAQHRPLFPSLAGQTLWPGVSFFGPGPCPGPVDLFPSDAKAEGRSSFSP